MTPNQRSQFNIKVVPDSCFLINLLVSLNKCYDIDWFVFCTFKHAYLILTHLYIYIQFDTVDVLFLLKTCFCFKHDTYSVLFQESCWGGAENIKYEGNIFVKPTWFHSVCSPHCKIMNADMQPIFRCKPLPISLTDCSQCNQVLHAKTRCECIAVYVR